VAEEHLPSAPWYHLNINVGFMGLIYGRDGVYDAKPEGFCPGASRSHNMMLPMARIVMQFESCQQWRC